jgi:hypothetical protein
VMRIYTKWPARRSGLNNVSWLYNIQLKVDLVKNKSSREGEVTYMHP